MPLAPGSAEAARIDAALAEWRQGDVALQEHWFLHAANGDQPLTAESEQAAAGLQTLTTEVEGLVVLTQTCDIVRSCVQRPFVEVAPLMQVDPADLRAITRGRRPAYAIVPATEQRRLVADLDRVMTVEKSIVATWARTPGCSTDSARRTFARALARKRVRVAFPDDFTILVTELAGRLQRKHDKNSDEGRALQALREIRVRAAPSWEAAAVEITFYFIPRSQDADFEGVAWHEWLGRWEKLVGPAGRFTRIFSAVRSLEDLTAREYVESDPLDLDHLSTRPS